jgi:hypothetical protein
MLRLLDTSLYAGKRPRSCRAASGGVMELALPTDWSLRARDLRVALAAAAVPLAPRDRQVQRVDDQ